MGRFDRPRCTRNWERSISGLCRARGVFGHPMGPAAGAASLRQGWEAVAKGMTLEDFSRHHAELKAAIAAFG